MEGPRTVRGALHGPDLAVPHRNERVSRLSREEVTASPVTRKPASHRAKRGRLDPALPRPLVASGRRGDAVELFQTKMVGIPDQVVVQMRHAPFRPGLEATAHTLVYEATIVGDLTLPTAQLKSIKAPTLVIYGGASPAFMGTGAKALAKALPEAHVRSLEGQSHDMAPAALAPG